MGFIDLVGGDCLSFWLHDKPKTTDPPELQCSHRLYLQLASYFPIFNDCSFFPQTLFLVPSLQMNKNHFPNEISHCSGFYSVLLYYFIEDRPPPPCPNNRISSRKRIPQLPTPSQPTSPTLLILAVRQARHLSGHKTDLAWESMRLGDKRGNAADNSRSCTVHKLSTSSHTHRWNLVPESTQGS